MEPLITAWERHALPKLPELPLRQHRKNGFLKAAGARLGARGCWHLQPVPSAGPKGAVSAGASRQGASPTPGPQQPCPGHPRVGWKGWVQAPLARKSREIKSGRSRPRRAPGHPGPGDRRVAPGSWSAVAALLQGGPGGMLLPAGSGQKLALSLAHVHRPDPAPENRAGALAPAMPVWAEDTAKAREGGCPGSCAARPGLGSRTLTTSPPSPLLLAAGAAVELPSPPGAEPNVAGEQPHHAGSEGGQEESGTTGRPMCRQTQGAEESSSPHSSLLALPSYNFLLFSSPHPPMWKGKSFFHLQKLMYASSW